MTESMYRGPRGVLLILDPDEIDEDDPGNGTPAIVKYAGGTSTFTCATNEGTVEAFDHLVELPEDVLEWLETRGEELINEMYKGKGV